MTGCGCSGWNSRTATCWTDHPEIGDWMAASRLDPFTARARAARLGVDAEATEHIGRYLDEHRTGAYAKLDALLAEPVAT